MSDNLRRYRAIRKALNTLCPNISGNAARHMNTLALLINGIVGSKSAQLPAVANQMADSTKTESRVDKCRRWLKNDRIDVETFYLPFCCELLASFSASLLPIAIDGSVMGKGCMCLMMSLLYKNRAIPLVWIVVKQKKGHMSEELHVALLKELHALIPTDKQCVLLGDGEFDGIKWQAQLQEYQWFYVLRTAKDTILIEGGQEFSFQELGIETGQDYFSIPEVSFTRAGYGPVHAVVWWKKRYKEPLYLVTNFELAKEVCYWYKKRYHIETFFSDQKSRGFNLQKSKLSDPKRIQRLLIAACLAYIWMIYLGELAIQKMWHHQFHRKSRCDLSLFQLGLRTVDYLLNQTMKIYVAFNPMAIE